MELHIAPTGNDDWSGNLAAPSANDGPLASIRGALRRIRSLTQPVQSGSSPQSSIAAIDGPVTVWLHGGRYELDETIHITPALATPVTFKACPGETPVLDGGFRINGWHETTVNGVAVWRAPLPVTATGPGEFRQLFVNGKRARRPRLPKHGTYRVGELVGYNMPPEKLGWGAPGHAQFRARPGEFQNFRNLTAVEVVALHYWIDERMPVREFDPATNLVTSTRITRAPLVEAWNGKLAPYYIDNVFEALNEPGEWYLDRGEKCCYYLPYPGETLATVEAYAPRLHLLIHLQGDAAQGQFVDWIRFEGITFRHSEWSMTGDPAVPASSLCAHATHQEIGHGLDSASCPQAAAAIPGAIRLDAARNCAFEKCRFEHLGWYGLELEKGCRSIRVVGNEFYDLGAGGIKINGGDTATPTATHTGLCRVTDNHLHELGRVFHAGVGILARHAFQNILSHNHIHDLYYTAISVGWVWGYRDTVTRDNYIEYNHLHDIGQGMLSDMGGIYTLGPQPGTVIRHNLVHDIISAQYGGWAIYPDEGTSHVLIENNLAYNTNCACFHQHYGRENIVRNNIFAFGRGGIVALGRKENHQSFLFYRNILLADHHFLYEGGYGWDAKGEAAFDAHANLVWDLSGTVTAACNKDGGTSGGHAAESLSWGDWCQGNDHFSVAADPKFRDPRHGDFTLAPDSPAFALGFKPIDLSAVGPRPN